MLQIEKIAASILKTNCYIIQEGNECVIIDCGGKDEVLKYIKSKNLKPIAILLTHGHYDHIGAVTNIRSEFNNVEVIACACEKELLENSEMNLSKNIFLKEMTISNVKYIDAKKDGTFELLGNTIKMIWTPGHTYGSCCYYFEKEKILFSGDTLFFETYGRYDLPTGSIDDLKESICNRLMSLDDDVTVLPGHGKATTIGYERQHNEFIERH